MSTTSHYPEVKNPGPYAVSGAAKALWLVFIAIGVATFVLGLRSDPSRAWAAFVQNHFYFLSLGLGGVFFASVQWLTGAMWSAPLRRVSESFSAYLPAVLVMFAILYFGLHDLYPWTHAEHVRGDLMLEKKATYLSVGFFMIRNVVAILLWIVFSRKLIGNSLKQDQERTYARTAANRRWSPGFLAVFAITFTMAGFDLLMSLDPHWYSTMFGVYCFAGLFYSTLALTCVLTIWLRSRGALQGIVNENHLHDLGKFMFAFTVFWAYIGFCQFMLIWYANLPEETGYFMRRFADGWFWVTIFLLVGKFMTPFFLLIQRQNKRDPRRLAFVGMFMLFAQWVDLLWLVQPEFFKTGPRVGWLEIGVTLGFIGVFGTLVARFWAKHSIVAIGDPRLAEAVHGHHI